VIKQTALALGLTLALTGSASAYCYPGSTYNTNDGTCTAKGPIAFDWTSQTVHSAAEAAKVIEGIPDPTCQQSAKILVLSKAEIAVIYCTFGYVRNNW
jgi:hypothetical protein